MGLKTKMKCITIAVPEEYISLLKIWKKNDKILNISDFFRHACRHEMERILCFEKAYVSEVEHHTETKIPRTMFELAQLYPDVKILGRVQ